MERLIVLDTETTGIEPSEGHRIIEIGCTEIVDREITENNEYHQYVQPERNVGDSVRIHGITDKFLTGKPKFEEIVSEFMDYIKGATLVIHNAPFDLGFLNHELKLFGSDDALKTIVRLLTHWSCLNNSVQVRYTTLTLYVAALKLMPVLELYMAPYLTHKFWHRFI